MKADHRISERQLLFDRLEKSFADVLRDPKATLDEPPRDERATDSHSGTAEAEHSRERMRDT